MHSNNKDFIIFVISFKTYKYRMLSFELTNDSIIYYQYINNIFFEYFNDFYQVYLNDSFIYNKARKNHIKYIRLIF